MNNNDSRQNFINFHANAIGLDAKPFIVCESDNEAEAFCPLGQGGWFASFEAPFELTEQQASHIVEAYAKRGKSVKMVSKILWSRNQLTAAR